MSEHVSYTIETNGQNGVSVEYVPISYIPKGISWVNGTNSFYQNRRLPNPEDYTTPEYVRKRNNGVYVYYRKTVVIPSKPVTFLVSILVDGSESGAYYYEMTSSFLRSSTTTFLSTLAILLTCSVNSSCCSK